MCVFLHLPSNQSAKGSFQPETRGLLGVSRIIGSTLDGHGSELELSNHQPLSLAQASEELLHAKAI